MGEKKKPEILLQKEIAHCSYKRYGLFDVRKEPPTIDPKEPDYIISIVEDPVLNDFFENNSYEEVYSDMYFIVYEKGA